MTSARVFCSDEYYNVYLNQEAQTTFWAALQTHGA